MSGNAEDIKRNSNNLRGGILKSLENPDEVKLSDDDESLIKFHGSYQGYNRDTATARKKQKLDKEWEFMVRAKLPGGRITADQYLALDKLADPRSNGTLRITSRSGIQFHNVAKGDLKPLIAEINEHMVTTFGACGDVVRNTTCNVSPVKSKVNLELQALAQKISEVTLPKSGAYHEIWVDGEKQKIDEEDGLYKDVFLTRKFKIAIALPEDNTIDVLVNDVGLIAFTKGDEIIGYNAYIGGGFGCKHNNPNTYPRIATPIAFVKPDDAVDFCLAVIKVLRDYGDRENRQHARLKYLVEEKGDSWMLEKIATYFNGNISTARETPKLNVKNHMGWHEQGDGLLYLGLPITSGRIKNGIRDAIREVEEEFRFPLIAMPTEDLIFCDVKETDKAKIEEIFKRHKVSMAQDHTPLEINAMSCVALPTCGKALTEGERARIPIIASIQKKLEEYGLGNERIGVRITGCPNGCSRPYTGDIGIVGRAPNIYSIYLGGDFEGTRLSYRVADKVKMENIPDFLEPFFEAFSKGRNQGEGFGDFCDRIGAFKRDSLSAKSAV